MFDLQKIEDTYSPNNGRKAYNVYSMFSMIIYAYTQGIYSCRAIEKQCRENIVFMWIMDLGTPDHSTIHRFQQRIIGTEKDLSAQQIQILLKKQLIDLANISIDGTKIRSVANKYTNVYRGTVGYHERKLEEKIAKSISRAITTSDNEQGKTYSEKKEDSNSIEIVEEPFLTIPDRIKKISKICIHDQNQPISKNINKKYAPQIELEQLFELIEWLLSLSQEQINSEASLKLLYKEMDSLFLRKIKYIEQRKNLGNRNSYSKTDKDACFMRMRDDFFDTKILSPGYNVHQANCSGYILHYGVSNVSADTRQLPSFVNELIEIDALTESSTLLADAGYGSLEDYDFLLNRKINYIIPYMNQRRSLKKTSCSR